MAKAIISIEGKTFEQFPDFVQGDFGTAIQFTIKELNNDAFNLAGFGVKFKSRLTGDTTNTIDGNCSITNRTSGICTYTLLSGDLDVIGKYDTEVEVSSPTKVTSVKTGDLVVVEEL